MIQGMFRIVIPTLLLGGVVALAATGSGFAALGIAAVAGFAIFYSRRHASR
jgi:hypothetical protein